MPAGREVATAGLRQAELLVDDDLLGQLDDLAERAEVVVELLLRRAEAHAEEHRRHELDHLQHVDARALRVGDAGRAARLEQRLEGRAPLLQLGAEPDAGRLDGRGEDVVGAGVEGGEGFVEAHDALAERVERGARFLGAHEALGDVGVFLRGGGRGRWR